MISPPHFDLGITGGPGIVPLVEAKLFGLHGLDMVSLAIETARAAFDGCEEWAAWAAGWLAGTNRHNATAYRAEMAVAFCRPWGEVLFPRWWAEMAARYAAGAARVLDAPCLETPGRCGVTSLAARSLACAIHAEREATA